MIQQNSLFWPLLIQVFLTFVLLFRMAFLRLTSIFKGEIKMGDIALGQRAWNERAIKAQNSFHNQLEMPILFYLGIVLAVLTGLNSMSFLVLSWIFAVARIVHALIHSTTNNVPMRFRFFLISCLSLLAQWVILALHLI
ncbi:MAG: MAPEG family protein [Pseudobdellovibrio sp.]